MNRHFYISDNLDELEQLESELEASGISTEQIHVLSEQDAEVEHHHLHDVSSFMKQDVVHSGQIGSLIGIALAALVLLTAWLNGWSDTPAGWVPFIFLAVVMIGFSVWEGSLFGLQQPNNAFRRFTERLHEGKHLFFVDVKPTQEPILNHIVAHHPRLEIAGIGNATPDWAMAVQQRWHQFRRLI
ncbi:NAD/FAD-utilizing enzyme apparently involved in cell division [Pseudomonas alcaligenes]|uniref:NAD/FAD-utilizing enzyme apparently involved in cell division n=1 Tax=Aquipseudomonas alcaligenes TaxID=43263 RepID=A0ABR7RYX7_AQUAC|nr:magnesium transporter [Pseudomonas alcaligenes]MBC9249952.1 NAD/FAD-utilizing enzyme apparently involved in cell division [Pseudomonas alcaligenes]